MSGSQLEKVTKELQLLFKVFGLNLLVECNDHHIYLDIKLNVLDRTCKPYQKLENTLQYIHKESNHPPNIIKQIPITVKTRLSNHSSNEIVFRQAVEDYEKTFKKSRYVMSKYSAN